MLAVVSTVDHAYVPPPTDGVAVKVAVAPAHIVSEFTVTVGAGVIVTVPEPVAGVQPPSEYVTVYDPAVVTLILGEVSPVDHAYVPPTTDGVAVKVAVDPAHVVAEFTVTVGAGLTFTTAVAGLLGQIDEV
jgi:hypothetical protein